MTARFSWAVVPDSPFDYDNGPPQKIIWVEELGLFVAVGGGSVSTTVAVATSPDGLDWTVQSVAGDETPFGSAGVATGIAWSPTLGLLVMCGTNPSGSLAAIYTSPDGVTWTSRGNQGNAAVTASIEWSEDQGLFVGVGSPDAGIGSPGATIVTSNDGETWIPQPDVVLDTGAGLVDVAYAAGGVQLWVAVGNAPTDRQIVTSPDGVVWTVQSSPDDGGITVATVAWVDSLDLIYVNGQWNGSTPAVMSSPDGVTWTPVASPLDVTGGGIGVETAGDLILIAGQNDVYSSASGADDEWDFETTAWGIGFARSTCWSPDLHRLLAYGIPSGSPYTGEALVIGTPFPTLPTGYPVFANDLRTA